VASTLIYDVPVFRILDVGPDGAATERQGPDSVAPPPAGTIRWIDLEAQDQAQLQLLQQRFGFHPLTVEDCAHFDQRAKMEEYGDYLFIVTHGIECHAAKAADLDIHEVHAFLGPSYLVTVHERPVAALTAAWKRCQGDAALPRRGADFIYYLVADGLVDMNFPLLDRLAEEIEDLEDRVIAKARRSDLQQIFALKRALVQIRKVLSPQRDVFGILAKRGGTIVSERTTLYFRDIYDHLVRLTESVESSRDLLGNALDAYLTMLSNRTNEIMKRLTIMSAIFLPLTFVTGFFGQNFEHLPFKSDLLMYSMIVACVLLPAGMLYWFYRSRWL
jgi:magnesium transporter